MVIPSDKYKKEIEALNQVLAQYRIVENPYEQVIHITEFFRKANNMEEFLCVYPTFRRVLNSKIYEFSHNLIHSSYPELFTTIQRTKEILEKIKFRNDYILDITLGEKQVKKIRTKK